MKGHYKKVIERIDDQEKLAEIVLKYKSLKVLEKITDNKILEEIAINDENRDVRRKALSKITDSDALFTIAMKGHYEKVIEHINDQEKLAEIVIKYESSIALEKISDKKTLTYIYNKLEQKYKKEEEKRGYRMVHEPVFREIKSKIYCPELYIAIKDENYEKLIEIAETNPDEDIICESLGALPKTNSEKLISRLIKIINSNNHPEIQKVATGLIKNKEVLIDLAKNSKSEYVREATLVELVDNLEVYQHIAIHDNNSSVLDKLSMMLVISARHWVQAEDYASIETTKDLLLIIFKKGTTSYDRDDVMNNIMNNEFLYDVNILMEMGKHLENEHAYTYEDKKLIEKLLSKLHLENTEKNCSNCNISVSKFSRAGEKCPHCNTVWSETIWK